MEKEVKSGSIGTTNKNILGTFEGECADANITNLNGLDITREVWENVFSSDDYKQGIDKGWLIGYLGHPEDPGCQEFQNACIVMTEGHIDDGGKVYGKFNLIDTPVGRIVKSFIDSGVQFGISVRGAGDITDNSVDPDTFIFRGFDLVAYPAYPESIPEFIAANTNVNKKKDKMKIFAAIKDNADKLNTVESIDIIQSHVAKQSKEYKILEARKQELQHKDDVISDIELSQQKVEALYDLYASKMVENKALKDEIKVLKNQIKQINSTNSRKLESVRRINASQLMKAQHDALTYQDKSETLQKVVSAKNSNISKLRKSYETQVAASRNKDNELSKYKNINASLKSKNDKLVDEVDSLKNRLNSIEASNLKYKKKVESNASITEDLQTTIASLQSELNETVNKLQDQEARTSNRDAVVSKLKEAIEASNNLVQDYQKAYADLYANALGVYLPEISVTASTDVKELQSIISSSYSKSKSLDIRPTYIDEDVDFTQTELDADDLVTL